MAHKKDTSHIDVRYVADLARLELTDSEIQRYGHELEAVLDYMAHLRELDLEGIEPMAHAVPRQNILRDDIPIACMDRSLIIDNAPVAAEDQYIIIPPVFDDDAEEVG